MVINPGLGILEMVWVPVELRPWSTKGLQMIKLHNSSHGTGPVLPVAVATIEVSQVAMVRGLQELPMSMCSSDTEANNVFLLGSALEATNPCVVVYYCKY